MFNCTQTRDPLRLLPFLLKASISMSTCYAKEGEHGLFLRKPIKHDCVCTGLDGTDRSQREGGKHVTQAWQGVHTETAGVKSESRNRLGAQPLSPRKLVAAHRGSQRKQEKFGKRKAGNARGLGAASWRAPPKYLRAEHSRTQGYPYCLSRQSKTCVCQPKTTETKTFNKCSPRSRPESTSSQTGILGGGQQELHELFCAIRQSTRSPARQGSAKPRSDI